MKKFTALAAASMLGLALIPAAANAQEYGGVPNSAYRELAPVQTGAGAFQALAAKGSSGATNVRGPAGDYTADQLEGMMSIHMGH